MAEIDQAEVRRLYKSMLDAGKSHAAMKKTRGALSPLFNTAIEERLIDFNPVTGVRIPAPPKNVGEDEDEERAKALKRGELAAFLEAVDPDWRLFFEFLTVTGVRIGEAIGLNWKNVVLVGDEPRVRVREQIYKGRRKKYPKSDEGKRDIPLAPAWVDRLTAHRDATYQGDGSPVFASAVGTPLVPGNVYRRVLAPAAIDAGLYVQVGPDVADVELREVVMRSGRRHLAPLSGALTLCGRRGALQPSADDHSGPSCAICEMAAEGLSRKGRKAAIAFHTFRHTCASLLFAEGRNVKQVAKWLGHADPAFTLRVYVSLLDEGLGEGLELIPPSDPVGVAVAD
jgi:integrase